MDDELRDVSLFGEHQELNNLTTEMANLYSTDFTQEPFLNEIISKLKLDSLPETFYTDRQSNLTGNFVFEIALDKEISRIIQFSSQHTLENVHIAIQNAFNFANDHLYAFYLNSQLWSEANYYHPESAMKPTADEARLGG